MDEKPKSASWKWPMVGLVLLVLYPLSLPPIMNLVISDRLPSAIRYFYRPVFLIADSLPIPAQDVWTWYYFKWSWVLNLGQ